MKFEFDSEIEQLEGKIKWSVMYFPCPTKWRKHGEIKISSLERRNVYNFIKT